MTEKLSVRDAVHSFAAGEPLRAALFLTYSFDGRWFEDAIVPDLCERPIATMLVLRDRNAIVSEAPSVRYHKANARSAVFHPKLALLVADHQARAIVTSANLTRGGFERQRELGQVFDIGPASRANHGLFQTLSEYLRTGVATEVCGTAAQAVADTAGALQEVLKQLDSPPASTSHFLLHNDAQSIWDQVLAHVPYRVLKRAAIVSPFFEPDRRNPEDPVLGPQDASIFSRLLFEDFRFEPPEGEPPVQVFFRQCEGRTELPIQKLLDHREMITFWAQDERQQRLHAKLILLEGAEGKGRNPFLMLLHGSPNFTSAGLLHRPPHGNAELAVLTKLPVKRKGYEHIIRLLGLEEGFHMIRDLEPLQTESCGDPPSPASGGVMDVTYHVARCEIRISTLEAVPIGSQVRVLLPRDGTWIVIGETEASGISELVVPVSGVAEVDPRTKLLELRATNLRIEIVGRDGEGEVVEVPLNVDVPEEFCGLTLVGTALLTLDERIARAGLGVPPTYREQQKWLETRKTPSPEAVGPTVASHQADLDRFYRNIHQGLRGILLRLKANPGSEFAVRRSLDELTRWTVEAATCDPAAITRECRLFLLERLLRATKTIVEGVAPGLKPRMPMIAEQLGLTERIARAVDWIDQIEDSALGSHAAHPKRHAGEIVAALQRGVAR
jgi:hypothetical protein